MTPIKYRQFYLASDVNGFKLPSRFHYWGYIYPQYPDSFVSPLSSEKARPSQRYTGLKDKNGVEIYEGDIVSLPTLKAPYPVVIEPLGVGLRDSKNKWQGQLYHRTFEMEVIGNIHENPDLLKQDKDVTA